MSHTNKIKCWCGNQELIPFSSEYMLCNHCQTLVLAIPVMEDMDSGSGEDSLYGKKYWFEHQVEDLGYDNIFTRTRKDLPERCLHWLKAFLKYKFPPGFTLELGSAHGGFVALMHWVGFHSAGLELNPWVVEYAKSTYQIPMYLGKIEDQEIEPHSLDAVILMDVLEHFPDPVISISYATRLLKEDGILMIQTPCYPQGKTYEELLATRDPFLLLLKAPEHIYLFSALSIQNFFEKLGYKNLYFEPAIFKHYDIFLVASKVPISPHGEKEIEDLLASSSVGHLIQALIDQDNTNKTLTGQVTELNQRLAEAEADRNARLEQIQQFQVWLEESEADRTNRLNQITQTNDLLEEAEKDRIARLEQILQYENWLEESEKDRAARWELIQQYEEKIHNQEQEIQSLNQTIIKMEDTFNWKLARLLNKGK
jgi:SAM-dependent methyltransferase